MNIGVDFFNLYLKVANEMSCHSNEIVSEIFFARFIKLELPSFLVLKSKKTSLLGYLKENVHCWINLKVISVFKGQVINL